MLGKRVQSKSPVSVTLPPSAIGANTLLIKVSFDGTDVTGRPLNFQLGRELRERGAVHPGGGAEHDPLQLRGIEAGGLDLATTPSRHGVHPAQAGSGVSGYRDRAVLVVTVEQHLSEVDGLDAVYVRPNDLAVSARPIGPAIVTTAVRGLMGASLPGHPSG